MSVARVLIIEDDTVSRQLYMRVLKKAEYNVQGVGTVSEARQMIHSEHFDLILCDMRLGTEHGVELLKEVSGMLNEQGTKVVAVSAEEQYRQACEEAGVEFFLSKPVSIKALVTLADRITVGHPDRTTPLILDTREVMKAKPENADPFEEA
jgi:DNA-binding NtrC family response regulator